MFRLSVYPAPVLRWRQGPVMSGLLTFMDRYRDEAACIAALAELRWPNGFTCVGCAGRLAYQLATRPRVFECADCGRQHSVTAGTVFHRTRTPLRKWFAAAWLRSHRQSTVADGSSARRCSRTGSAAGSRFRRTADQTEFLLRRAATRPTITYRQLVDGAQINGALPALTG